MKAGDLRVGNYFIFGEMRHACSYHDIANLEKDEANGVESPTYQPIPITKYFLLMFGFEYIQPLWVIDNDKFHTFKILLDDKVNGIHFPFIASSDGEHFKLYGIRYIHQLQNLYYALTGAELKIR